MRTSTSRRASARRMPRRAALSAVLALAVAAPAAMATTAASAAPTGDPDRGAIGYLVDGLGPFEAATPGDAADVVLAAAAVGTAGDDAAAIFDAIDDVDQATPGVAAKVLLAAAALDELDRDTADDAEAVLVGAIDAETGQVGGAVQLFTQSLSILALEAADVDVPAEVVAFLVDQACEDGGYVFQGAPGCDGDFGSDTDATAVAAQALLAATGDAADPIDWLLDNQDEATGGFSSYDTLNSNSSALAAQALRAAGEAEAADAAAAHVATFFDGCDAAVDVRGSYRYAADAAGFRSISTSQAVFADAERMDLLSLDGATAVTERLNCSATFCPPDTGISVVVDFTDQAPDADVEVRCATDLPDDPNGIDVLRAAGFELETDEFDFGDGPSEFVCTIEGLPELPDGECFSDDGFFGYSNAPQGGDWTTYQVGGSDSEPQPGTIEGWAWAPGFVGGPPRVSTTPAGFVDLTPDPVAPTPPFDRGLANVCPGTYTAAFTDVPAASLHARAIACLGATPIVRGTGDGSTFSPADDVTRDQIASLLARAIERATGAPLPVGDVRFDDTAGSVHTDAIHALASAGIIRGTGDGSSFSPREPLERQQMASLLDRTLDLLDGGTVDGSFPPPAAVRPVFTDEPSSVHAGAVDRLGNQGVIAGRADGSFGPRVDVRRDQVVSFVARALDLAVEEGLAAPIAGR